MPDKRGAAGGPSRVLLLGGTSEIGLEILAALHLSRDTEVLLAGRDEQRMAAAGKELGTRVRTLRFDATALDTHQALIGEAFAGGEVDLRVYPESPHGFTSFPTAMAAAALRDIESWLCRCLLGQSWAASPRAS